MENGQLQNAHDNQTSVGAAKRKPDSREHAIVTSFKLMGCQSYGFESLIVVVSEKAGNLEFASTRHQSSLISEAAKRLQGKFTICFKCSFEISITRLINPTSELHTKTAVFE